ncbi:hypothetical protein HYY71_05575 [Candidatus Woesearchaeota archaeon]|nr:hypothetical protein [Candidatus Woesearchaeota archaeon]
MRTFKLRNKAQTSFFAIAGIIMLLALLLGFFIYSNIKSKAQEEAKQIFGLSLQAEEVEKFVNDCIRKASFEGLKKLGDTGGYLDAPKLISFRGTGLWHLEQVNIQPFLNQTQERLMQYINSNVPACLDEGKITELGFNLERGHPITAMEFGASDVTIKVIYPLILSKEKFTKEFSEFFNAFDIRYRAIFEAAAEINEKTFDADFDSNNPLKKLDYLKNLDFDVAYRSPETDMLVFTVTDKKSITAANEFYAFSFAVKLGNSELKKMTDLQNKSSTNPTFMPYTISSVDKNAQLDISEGTTMNLNGQNVGKIIVQQSYPPNVVTKNVPVEKENKEIKRREDINYVIDNPVYSFEPDGLIFNKLQKLTIYYDDPQGKDAKGVGILKGKNGFWVPIPSEEDKENRKVFAKIIGFTDFTAIFCQSQQLKKAVARNVFEPNAGCYVQLGIMILALALMIYLGPAIFGAFSAGAAGAAEGATIGILGSIGEGIMTQIPSLIGTIAPATLGGLYVAFSIVSIGISVAGTATEAFYTDSPENCQGFVPTCTWQVGVDVVEKDGEGKCIPEGGTFRAGVPVQLCAQVEKCNFIEKFTCQKCSVECTAQYY